MTQNIYDNQKFFDQYNRLRRSTDGRDKTEQRTCLHYIDDLNRLMAEVYRSLVPGGSLIFSVEHPIYTAPADPNWSVNAAGRKTWPIDS